MLIPQAIQLLRRAMNDSEVAKDLANVSVSTGAFHERSRLVTQILQLPDFVTVKVTPQPGIDCDHISSASRKSSEAMTLKQSQRNKWKLIWNKQQNLPQREESLRGYLVMGDMSAYSGYRMTRMGWRFGWMSRHLPCRPLMISFPVNSARSIQNSVGRQGEGGGWAIVPNTMCCNKVQDDDEDGERTCCPNSQKFPFHLVVLY